MPRLEWTSPAADELESAQTYYYDLNPRAAQILAQRIIDAAFLRFDSDWIDQKLRYVATGQLAALSSASVGAGKCSANHACHRGASRSTLAAAVAS